MFFWNFFYKKKNIKNAFYIYESDHINDALVRLHWLRVPRSESSTKMLFWSTVQVLHGLHQTLSNGVVLGATCRERIAHLYTILHPRGEVTEIMSNSWQAAASVTMTTRTECTHTNESNNSGKQRTTSSRFQTLLSTPGKVIQEEEKYQNF